ncbi:hypothetical protein [Ferruginivarius sediminum]|uniref:Lipoprotein n=1 Tax=Ferruginivarius sediminum TaxID=2661937 RepID=A0A369TEQ2_9PROT|nr:hypothetical protein [Ferruginivarius sediminum]RDD62855.1 hypothetical protein DRB17_06775 [Ferruginivarius sediminum]
MLRQAVIPALALALAACAADGGAGGHEGGNATVRAVGTPFLVAFKVPACVATVAMAAPLAAIFEMADPPRRAGQEALGYGVSRNCGPPYVPGPRANRRDGG